MAAGDTLVDAPALRASLPDHYLLRGRLKGRGAPVMLAVDRRDERPVVIKGGGAELRHEAAILERLEHPQVVRLHECLEDGDRFFLVLDHVRGEDLSRRLASGGRLAEGEVETLIRALAGPLSHLHARGVIHRDLKPANVLLRPDGTPVLADLGAALAIDEALDPPQVSALSAPYAAPEQSREGGPEGPWTDVYGLGALALRLLTGHPPPARVGELEAIGGGLGIAVGRALGTDPTRRPSSIPALLALLDQPPAADRPQAGEDMTPLPDQDPPWPDDPPPTIRIRRRAAARPTRRDVPPPVRTTRRRGGLVRVALALVLLVALAAAASLPLRPLYDRHVKTTWLVDAGGDGDALTIRDALERAGPGARITVRAGRYGEPLALAEAVELVAEDPADPPLIAVEAAPCLTSATEGAVLAGLSFSAATAPEGAACLTIEGGDLRVTGGSVTASEGPAVRIAGGAAPRLEGVAVRDGGGMVIGGGAAPAIADGTFAGLIGPALIARGGSRPEITGSRISASGPVVFTQGAGGRFADNEVEAASGSAIEVTSGARPTIENNRIRAAAEVGVLVYDAGRPAVSANEIVGAGLSGVLVEEGAAGRLSGNRIDASGEHGILVLDRARVIVEGNQVTGSRGRGIAVAPTAEVELIDNVLEGNAAPQLLDARPGRGGGGGDR